MALASGHPLPNREPLNGADPCAIASRWAISEELANRLKCAVDRFAGPQLPGQQPIVPVQIISGARSPVDQDRLRREGRPTADNDRSTHLSCPATGADISLPFGTTRATIARWGEAVTLCGMRWGGGSAVDDVGIPSDWRHVDLGPRRV